MSELTLDRGLESADDDPRLALAIQRERSRLWNFIRQRVPDPGDAEDVLQDVFYELVESYQLTKPIEHLGAWLFAVARNRIADLLRKKRPRALEDAIGAAEVSDDGERLGLEAVLPSPDSGPEAAYVRRVLLEELAHALEELPAEQRDVFIAHELDGTSFKALAAATGVNANTLLARKRYAILHLRRRLRDIYEELTDEEPES